MMKTKQSTNTRNTIYNFIINRIHTRDLITLMLQEKDAIQQEDFLWQIQVKYHYIMHKPYDLNLKDLPDSDDERKEEKKRLAKKKTEADEDDIDNKA